MIGAAFIAALLIYAWIDGGEKSLRPIAEPVPQPNGMAGPEE